MQHSIGRINDILRRLNHSENCCQTDVSYLRIYRFTGNKISMPQIDNPYLYIVKDGSMRMYTPSGIMDYM